MESISIIELKRLDLRNALVIDGFPGVGVVSSIVARYIIDIYEMEQIGIVDSVLFPAVALIRSAEPFSTVRIYAGGIPTNDDRKVVVIVSEFQPPQNLIKSIAKTILDWLEEQRCGILICPEGLVIEREGSQEKVSQEVYGVASTPTWRRVFKEKGISIFTEGVITGIAGVFLNEGKIREFDVISIMAEAKPDYPDARAAAKVIEGINKLFPEFNIDPEPLYVQAEAIEKHIQSLQKQASTAKTIPPPPSMYG